MERATVAAKVPALRDASMALGALRNSGISGGGNSGNSGGGRPPTFKRKPLSHAAGHAAGPATGPATKARKLLAGAAAAAGAAEGAAAERAGARAGAPEGGASTDALAALGALYGDTSDLDD